ncbi:MAG: BatA domain-containing protein [Phycisphaerae bacterium]
MGWQWAQSVLFIHPSMVGAALALGLIPVIVHMISRHRYRPVVWAAMRFLDAARSRNRRRVWLEHWVLMLLRIALVLLLGLGIARPYIPSLSFLPLRSTCTHHVMLIDNSLSMSARGEHGRTRFSLAREYAERLLTSFPDNDGVSLVTLVHPATAVISRAGYDRRLVRDRLAAIQPTQRTVDTLGGIARAREILDESDTPAENRAVYLISDFPQRLWSAGKIEAGGGAVEVTPTIRAVRGLAGALPHAEADFNVVRIAPDAGVNIAVTELALDSTLVAVDLPVRLTSEVTNFGGSAARGLHLRVQRDGEVLRDEPLPTIEPGASTAAAIPLYFSTRGIHTVEVRILGAFGDVLAEDNARRLSLEVREAIPVLLVDGRPGPTLLSGQAGFLATALSPGVDSSRKDWESQRVAPTTRKALVDAKVVSVGELDGEVVGDYDVVALCNVRRLSSDQWHRVESYVAQGGGLLVFGGDQVSLDNYNDFGHAEGAGVLPLRFTPASAPDPRDGNYTSFQPRGLTHAIVAEFAEHAGSGLFLARVDRHLTAVVDPGRGDVALRYTDGDPALVTSTFRRGRVAVYTTTAGMDWTNLPAKGDYVSLMLNTVAYLSLHRGQHRNVLVGQTLSEALTPLQTGLPLRVVAGHGVEDGRLVPFSGGLALEYGPTERAGEYSLMLGSERRAFACNVDTAESDLEPTDERALAAAIGRPINMVTVTDTPPGTVGAHKVPASRSSELATTALCAVAVLLIAEMLLAMWFGSRRAGLARPVAADTRFPSFAPRGPLVGPSAIEGVHSTRDAALREGHR